MEVMLWSMIFDNCVAYSFGISDDVSWDFDIAKRGIE